jgi:hypothetical protein
MPHALIIVGKHWIAVVAPAEPSEPDCRTIGLIRINCKDYPVPTVFAVYRRPGLERPFKNEFGIAAEIAIVIQLNVNYFERNISVPQLERACPSERILQTAINTEQPFATVIH